jgi:hypothetical protein
VSRRYAISSSYGACIFDERWKLLLRQQVEFAFHVCISDRQKFLFSLWRWILISAVFTLIAQRVDLSVRIMRLQINPHAISCHRDECGSSFVTVWFITPRDDESAAD